MAHASNPAPAPAYAALTTPTGGFRSATGGASLTPYSYGAERITGMCSKFSGGGGEDVCHSRPREFHGFPVSFTRQNRVDQMKLNRKMSIETPSRKAEIDTQTLSGCRFSAYWNTRRGWPSIPTANSGRNVELKKMNMVQKWILPSLSFSLIPIILGSQ